MPPFKDIAKGGVILCAALSFIWVFMIKPNSYVWQEAGETQGTVRTLMTNSKVIGQPQIKAIIDFKTGGSTIINVPIKSDVRKGDSVLMRIQEDVDNAERRRYFFIREIT